MDGGITAEFNGARSGTDAEQTKEFHCTKEDVARGLVFMEQVSPKKNEVHLLVKFQSKGIRSILENVASIGELHFS